jgi:hypothetical protein
MLNIQKPNNANNSHSIYAIANAIHREELTKVQSKEPLNFKELNDILSTEYPNLHIETIYNNSFSKKVPKKLWEHYFKNAKWEECEATEMPLLFICEPNDKCQSNIIAGFITKEKTIKISSSSNLGILEYSFKEASELGIIQIIAFIISPTNTILVTNYPEK